jgi:hypothetical protein
MKRNDILVSLLMAMIMTGCASPAYLPSYTDVAVNRYGSFIEVRTEEWKTIDGELIAADSASIIILDSELGTCVRVPVASVKDYSVAYAHPESYGPLMPLYLLSTLSHGIGLIITFPLNPIVTTAVVWTAESAYTYDKDDIPITDPAKFARFPQGVPPSVNLSSIGAVK